MYKAAFGDVVDLEVRLLGQPSIAAYGVSVKLAKRTTTLAMLGWIVLQRGEAGSREALAHTLFPNLDKETALAELGRYLALASRALPARIGRPWLIADAKTVRWNADNDTFVDAIEFEHLASAASTQAAAIELYAGDLLEGYYDDSDWIVTERERLRALYLKTLREVIAANSSVRNYSAALAYVRRFLAIEPWQEDMVRQAMTIHYASGDSSGALAEYDRFATLLRDEMRVSPMPETLALREAIVSGEALIGSVDAAVSIGSDPADRQTVRALPFIGRERERAALQTHWDRAAAGFGGVVLVAGEAGIGKTRLIGELAQVAKARGGQVYAGSTSSPESLPYQCIVEALRAALPALTSRALDPLALGVLSGILPELRAQGGDALEIAQLEPDRELARLFASLADAVVRLASPQPMLLVLEDMHWAAGATIGALAAIARRIDRARVLIVVTYREEETPATHPVRSLVDALAAERRATELHLERFSHDTVAQLVAQLDSLGERDEAAIDRLYAFSEGNALFLNEAIANAVESAGDASGDGALPLRGIAHVIDARTARLGKLARMVAEIAAICGHGCSVDVVRDVAGLSAAQTSEAFNELADRRLVREAGARDRFDYVFTHHLIGASIYDQIDGQMRVRRHARIAHVLEERAVRRVGVVRELARHYDLAGMTEQAAQWYVNAAREAAAVYAHDDAAALATLAIERLSDPASLIDALFIREESNGRLGHPAAQAADLDRLEQLAGSAELRCRILSRRVLVLRTSDYGEAEHGAIEALRMHASALGDRHWQGQAACADARFLVATGQYSAAKEAASEALAHFETVEAERDRIDPLLSLIDANEAMGERDEADRLLELARSIASRAGDRQAAVETLMQAVKSSIERWQLERAAALSQEALEEYRAIGDRVGEALALTRYAHVALYLSQWSRARDANLAAARTLEMVDYGPGLATVLWNLGLLHLRCGDFARARAYYKRARKSFERSGHRYGRASCLLMESLVAVWQGRARGAKSIAQAALEGGREMDRAQLRALALANLGLAERDLGELDAALSHMAEGLALERRLGRPPTPGNLADAALAHAMRGELATATRLAEEVLTSGRMLSHTTTFPPHPPWIAACVFHWSGDEKRARQALGWASQLARSHAESIDVPELRAHFEALPFNAAIAAAKDADLWPPLPG